MKAICQRVQSASVTVDGEIVGRCGYGLLVLAAAHRDDRIEDAKKAADRIWGIRIFNDAEGKMNLSLKSLQEIGEPVGVLAVSNFTIYGDTAAQRRPSFIQAAAFERGKELFDAFVEELRGLGCPTETGVFGAHMIVEPVLDGPVTVIVEVPAKSG